MRCRRRGRGDGDGTTGTVRRGRGDGDGPAGTGTTRDGPNVRQRQSRLWAVLPTKGRRTHAGTENVLFYASFQHPTRKT